MSPKEICAQVIGAVAMVFIFLSYQQKKRKGILVMQICSGLLFTLHFVLLGAYPGAAMNLLGAFRSFVYSSRDKKWAKPEVWLWIFIAAFTAAGILTWDGPLSVLPMGAMLLTTVSLNLTEPRKIRFVTFPSSPMWFVYDLLKHSFSGVLTEIFVMISLITAIVRYDIIGRKKERTAPGAETDGGKTE